jgi:DNA-binding LytR/AlgR family response regulator
MIIDDDRPAVDELTSLLQNHHLARPVGTPSSVAQAADIFRQRPAPLLFIRITMWDDYLKEQPSLPTPPAIVVFLSGRMEKCTYDLGEEVDFHLQPPYKLSNLIEVFKRMDNPGFQRRSLDFFFLKSNCRYTAIYFCDLKSIVSQGGFLQVLTTRGEYMVIGGLAQFQRRLPFTLNRVGRSQLVAKNNSKQDEQ